MDAWIKALDTWKRRERITSDYEAARRLGLPKQRLSDYRKGLRVPDAYACFRLGTLAGVDPVTLLAEVEARSERNPQRRAWWEHFLRSAAKHAFTLGLIFIGSWSAVPNTSHAAKPDITTHYTHYFTPNDLKETLYGDWHGNCPFGERLALRAVSPDSNHLRQNDIGA